MPMCPSREVPVENDAIMCSIGRKWAASLRRYLVKRYRNAMARCASRAGGAHAGFISLAWPPRPRGMFGRAATYLEGHRRAAAIRLAAVLFVRQRVAEHVVQDCRECFETSGMRLASLVTSEAIEPRSDFSTLTGSGATETRLRPKCEDCARIGIASTRKGGGRGRRWVHILGRVGHVHCGPLRKRPKE